jgi:LysM repeat protein
MPSAAGSPFDLVNAVNALRASYGLSPYSVNSILMFTAQSQAEFMAATGNVSHIGSGGSDLTDRLLAAGYPLAGDLSLGGFRAENITSGKEDRSVQSVVDGWTGDALHLNTMISPNLSEIGAGVAIANGRVYYVIDCALPATGELPPGSTSVAGSESAVPSAEAMLSVAVVSTPNPEGDVIHEVQVGQSLWQIAIAYEVKIDDIKRLNNLFDNDIYPGSKLLIKTDVMTPMVPVVPTASMTEVPTSKPTAIQTNVLVSPVPTWLSTPSTAASVTSPSSAITAGTTVDNNFIMGVVIGIMVLAILGWSFHMAGK